MKFNVLIKELVPLSVLSHPTSTTMAGLTSSRDEISTILRSTVHIRLEMRCATNTPVTLVIVATIPIQMSVLSLTVSNVSDMTNRSTSCEVMRSSWSMFLLTTSFLQRSTAISIQWFPLGASSKRAIGNTLTSLSQFAWARVFGFS